MANTEIARASKRIATIGVSGLDKFGLTIIQYYPLKLLEYFDIIMCETWSLISREERRLRMFGNRVLWRIFGPKRDGVTGNGENYVTRSLMFCTTHPILCG